MTKLTSHHIDEDYWASLLQEDTHTSNSPMTHRTTPVEPQHNDKLQAETNLADWHSIEEITQNDLTISLRVIGYNRGGVLVEYQSLRGFVPSSQLFDYPAHDTLINRRNALISHIGRMLDLRVIELDSAKNRLILSERAAQAQPGERQDILNTLKEGDIIEGDVTNIVEFGAFIDLGGLEGLIHISELSWGRVSHPSRILKRGETVRASVLTVDQSAGRVALSLKRLCDDPWQSVQDDYHIGQIITGEITNIVEFGAFVCVAQGLEGLIHLSELAEGQFLHPRNVVSEGETVQARIISINRDERRLGLSLRLTV
jgi:small subunit ribosomal protein S1